MLRLLFSKMNAGVPSNAIKVQAKNLMGKVQPTANASFPGSGLEADGGDIAADAAQYGYNYDLPSDQALVPYEGE